MDPPISLSSLLDSLFCQFHKKRPLEWLCLDRECAERLFCSFCVISEHKKVHSEFVPLKSFLSDPFSTFNSYLTRTDDEEEEQEAGVCLKEKIQNLIKKNCERIDLICSKVVNEIYKKFHEIKVHYHDEMERFLQNHEKDYLRLEEIRKQFLEFSQEYYREDSLEKKIGAGFNLEQIKEGINIICNKYYSNTELLNFFETRVNSLPQIILKDDYKVIIDQYNLCNIKWNYFADKCLSTWTFNTRLLPNEFSFTNNDLTAKSKELNHGTTLVGNEVLEEGYHRWCILVEEKQGEYLNIGVIPVNINMNYNMCNYLDAFCISSDNSVYNGSKFNGNFSINKGDVVELMLDFDEDIFVIKNNKFKYEKVNIKGKRLLPYVGFSSFSSTKVTITK